MAVRVLGERSGSDDTAPSPCFGFGTCRREGRFELADLRPALPEDAVEPHEHDEAHFVLVLEGSYVSSAAGAPPLQSGPLLIFNPPGTIHRDRFRGDGRFVAIGCPSAEDACAALPVLPMQLRGRALSAALRVAAGVHQPEADLDGLCWELIEAAGRAAPAAGTPAWLGRARAMIDDGPGSPLPLSRVAAECGVHPVHLARTFRSAFGCAPSDYQAFARLRLARRLVAETRLSLADVALEAGFADQSHFTRAFSRRFGLPPGEFRAAVANV